MGKKLAVGAIIGAAVGVVAGILTAPKSGKETRDDLKTKAKAVKDKAETAKDEMVERAEGMVDTIKAKAKRPVSKDSRKR
jgi:gas vesicle protein